MSRSTKDRIFKIRLKKGDNVIITAGKYKGRTGKIMATHPSLNKVTVEGINLVKRHYKPDRARPQGGIVEITKPIWVSKVAIIDPASKKASKIGYSLNSATDKSRVFKRSGKEIK